MYKNIQTAVLLVFAAGAAAAADKSGYTLANPVPPALLRKLSTDRPDQTESPYTVEAGHLQIELDIFKHTRDHDTAAGGDVRRRDWSVVPLNLKLGLTDRLDLQLLIDPRVSSRVEDRAAGTTTRVSGFGNVTTRLKINFWGNDGGKTAFGLLPYVKWPLAASAVRNGKTEGGVILPFGAELPGGWGLGAQTAVGFLSDGTGGYDTEWLNSITFSRDLTGRLGGYLEFVAVTGDAPGFRWEGQFDAGLTYALDDNTQLDLGCNFGVTNSAPDYQPFVGVSRRF